MRNKFLNAVRSGSGGMNLNAALALALNSLSWTHAVLPRKLLLISLPLGLPVS
jgi:hypothetical protein